MRVLFVTNTVPFPPRHGVELTNAHIIAGLAERHEVDVAVAAPSAGDVEYEARRPNVPGTVRSLSRVRLEPASAWRRTVGELAGRRPAFFLRKFRRADVEAIMRGDHDVLWASPVGCLGIVDYCRANGVPMPPSVALGLNDVKTTLYEDMFRQAVRGRLGWSSRGLMRGLRVPIVRRHERRYLREVDLVHVMTEQERRRALRLLDGSRRTRVVVAPNGRKRELERVTYHGRDSERVVFMTHLDGARQHESRWMLQHVWPRVRARCPRARLLLVGTPPPPGSRLREALPAGAEIVGYVQDLVALYSSVALAVVPTVHATGIINRIQDALTAGVPTVTTPEAASTIAGLSPGVHAEVCASADDFAAAVIGLLEAKERRDLLSRASRAFARRQPTWDDTIETLVGALEGLAKHEPSRLIGRLP